jgi:transposase
VGLTPSSHSSGGKARLGAISKRGNKTLRTLLIVGATSVLKLAKQGMALPRWTGALLARRPFKVVAVAKGQHDGPDHLGVASQGRAVQGAPAMAKA